jgi:guanylate kinase
MFAEHYRVHLYKYGTPKGPLEKVRRDGGVMLLDVDVQGASRLRRIIPEAIAIFVLPPSATALRTRLKQRGTETRAQLTLRYKNALKEMRSFRRHGFDYVVINKELDQAVKKVLAVITAHDCRLDKYNVEQIRKITG